MKTFIQKHHLICLFLLFPHFLLSQSIGEITWTDSFLNEEDQIPTNRMKFGYLTVPENYEKPAGKSLKIAFVVIKAARNESAKDACIYFMGGWGSRTIKNLSYYQKHFLSYRRDLILYDYRGTGYSEPKLCESLGADVFKNVLADISYEDFENA